MLEFLKYSVLKIDISGTCCISVYVVVRVFSLIARVLLGYCGWFLRHCYMVSKVFRVALNMLKLCL